MGIRAGVILCSLVPPVWDRHPCTCYCHFIKYFAVWGVEPSVTQQTSWLESTGVCATLLSMASWHQTISFVQAHD